MSPLVSVICLCYNHERFVKEAVESVLNQTYPALEVLIVDDASTDNSRIIIENLVRTYPAIKYIPIEKNVGNCKAFNIGFAASSGQFIVDFATDDVMVPDRLSKQVEFFSGLDERYGVVFTEAVYIDAEGNVLREHFSYLKNKGLLDTIPVGNVYAAILEKYFVCSPTMLVKREVFESLNGYDESLAYEDFDFWVRSSRRYLYGYLDIVSTKVRRTGKSLSSGAYIPGDRQLHSTYLVCKKAKILSSTEEEINALVSRLRYEIRQSVFSQNKKEAVLFFDLLCEIRSPGLQENMLMFLNSMNLPLSTLRKMYHQFRYD